MGRKDAEGTFVRDTCGMRLAGAGGNIVCFTADGKILGAPYPNARGIQSDPPRALAEWKSLPEAARRPGSVKVGERGPLDPSAAAPEPPRDGLILKQYYRMLAVDDSKQLRHVVLKDFDHAELLTKYRDPGARRHYYEAAPDFVWLTADEWKSLIPPSPRTGDSRPLPGALLQRLVRFHLVPDITFGESNGWQKEQVRRSEATLTVEQATPALVRLRLEGLAHLGLDHETAAARVKDGKHSSHGYEPRLLGYIDYDVEKARIVRFDLVALGDFYGTLYGDNRRLFRSGRTPLGVAFQLVTEQSPSADRQVVPRAMRIGPKRYFEGY